MANVDESFLALGTEVNDTLLFFETTFNERVLLEKICGSKTLKFVRCVFEKEVNLSNFMNTEIVFSKCIFKNRLIVQKIKTKDFSLEFNQFHLAADFINLEADIMICRGNITSVNVLQFFQPIIKSLRISDK